MAQSHNLNHSWLLHQSDTYVFQWNFITRPTLERRRTLGHLRSINCNMIIHFANQSQSCQLLRILKKHFFFKHFMERNCEVVQSIPGWTDIENPSRLSRASCMSSSWYNILTISPSVPVGSEFTGWAIIEELSIRRRLHTFLISCGQKMRVKHCYVDLSTWYELWLAIICIDIDVIFDLSTTISNNFRDGFDCLGQHGESFSLKYNDMK